MNEIRKKAMSIYKPPFRFEHGYIWDANNNIVSDDHVEADYQVSRVRGWGRISYMKDAEAIQDEIWVIVAEAMTNFWMDSKND